MRSNFQQTLLDYLRAGYPAIYISTYEEERVEAEMAGVAASREREFWRWSITKGWTDGKRIIEAQDPFRAVEVVKQFPEGAVCVLRDFHFYLESPEVIRAVRDIIPFCKATGRVLLFLSCRVALPPELEKDVVVLPYDLPDRKALSRILDGVVEAANGQGKLEEALRPRLLDAAAGLTAAEAENAFALAIVRHGGMLDGQAVITVQDEKAGAVRRTGILEIHEPPEGGLNKVGGLDGLKAWLGQRAKALGDEARKFGLPCPRGILMVGPPGSGKSLTAKAVAASWGLPLLRLDLGKVFGSLVGASEEAIRGACALADAVAPCVLWIDEIEKGLAGSRSSGSTDSGVTARVMGTLLTWLTERKGSTVFVVATANAIDQLPPELLRKGRLDEIFFIDLPHELERLHIASIHLGKRGRDPESFDLQAIVAASKLCSGAEIEEAIVSGLFAAFDEGRELETKDIVIALKSTVSLSVTMKVEIDRVREWAKTRARPATLPITVEAPTRRRFEK